MKVTRTLLRKYNWYTPAVWGSAIFEFAFLTIETTALLPIAIVVAVVKYFQRVINRNFKTTQKTKNDE